jgi:hypothetical protein
MLVTDLQAQVNFGTRGPANLDTSKLAHIYIIRDGKADTTVKWIGLWNDENLIIGLSKVYANSIYRVNTGMFGKHKIWTMNGDTKDSVELEIEPSKNYYLEIHANKDEKGLVHGKLNLIEEKDATIRIREHDEKVIEQYGVIPIIGSIELLANVYKDTVSWIAGKNHIYRFLPIKSWECMNRSATNSHFFFFDAQETGHFKESGSLLFANRKKFKSQKDFETYCREELIETHYEGNVFATIKIELRSIQSPEGIKYAYLNSYEGLNIKDTTELKSQIYSRAVSIAFYWEDEKGKGTTAVLYNGESGLQKEIHTTRDLEEELLGCWNSFRLISLKSINGEFRTVTQ